jgi:hypothetical protein
VQDNVRRECENDSDMGSAGATRIADPFATGGPSQTA